MNRREMDRMSMGIDMAEGNDNNVMLTTKFHLADKVKISHNVKVDQNGKDIAETERDLEFVVTQIYGDKKTYFISNGDYKHKLLAEELVKVTK